LFRSGLRSQAVLAERIAELEGLDSAPRDLVNRAFRQRSIEHLSLQRIATALEIPVHVLLLNSDDPSHPPGTAEPDQQSATVARPQFSWHWHYAFWGVLLVSLSAVLLFTLWNRSQYTPVSQPQDLSRMSALVLPFEQPQHDQLTTLVGMALDKHFSLGSPTALAIDENVADTARRLGVDVILELKLVEQRRLVGVRAWMLFSGMRKLVWSESLPRVDVPNQYARLSASITRSVLHTLRFGEPASKVIDTVAQDDYLMGEYYLDEPASELNLRRAESRFEAALRRFPDYALAHAGLCHALLEGYWMNDAERALEDARLACQRAHELDPQAPEVKIARAHLQRRSGSNERALQSYAAILADHPFYPSAHQGFAASLLDTYRQTGDSAYLTQAMQHAQRAGELDEQLWKPLFNLGLMYWFAGDVQSAIRVSEEGLSRHQNEKLLANLGTLYVCVGRFAEARQAYEAAHSSAPESYVGREFLGMIYYFLGDFPRAIELRTQAIASVAERGPEIHEIWGHLADAYRHNGDSALAVESYRRAIDIAERDYLSGTLPLADEAARAYYYLMLHELAPALLDARVVAQIVDDLSRIEGLQTEATAFRRMAQSWLLLGQRERALQSLAQATENCPGYALTPDFKQLLPDITGPEVMRHGRLDRQQAERAESIR
ncbi:MAG: tetratricopeptide repeat protein, partial [Pseudomonadales bacterium]